MGFPRKTIQYVVLLVLIFLSTNYLSAQEKKILRTTPVKEINKQELIKNFNLLKPDYAKNLPDTLLLGDFTMLVHGYKDKGSYSPTTKEVSKLSGKGEIGFNCGLFFTFPFFPSDCTMISLEYTAVETVTSPEHEISIEDARFINPRIRPGEIMKMELPVKSASKADILAAKIDFFEKLKPKVKAGNLLVEFENISFKSTGKQNVGEVTSGHAFYPTDPVIPDLPVKIYIGGFAVHIYGLDITKDNATIVANVELPRSIFDAEGCKPAMIELGKVDITSDCQLYKEMPSADFGPFIIDPTGMTIEGTGVIVDLSETQSASGYLASWRGIIFKNGHTIAAKDTVISNTGYLQADYKFSNAQVTLTGLKAQFNLNAGFDFYPLFPSGYKISLNTGCLSIDSNAVKGGNFNNGIIELPIKSVVKKNPGEFVKAEYLKLNVQKDLDLDGEVKVNDRFFWGELTHQGKELTAYEARARFNDPEHAYFYLSGQPKERFVPNSPADYAGMNFFGGIAKKLEEKNLVGVTILKFAEYMIFTPDIPDPANNVIRFIDGSGAHLGNSWLNIELNGVHGEIQIFTNNKDEQLGDSSITYYKGDIPFQATFHNLDNKERRFFVKYSSSAVYDAEFNGFIKLGPPSNVKIPFMDLEVTSTAHIVGGDIYLDSDSDSLEYWGVKLVETSPGDPAGVLSVKTGQIILTQAGIMEPRHFGASFNLIWGELLADGNLGELFFDYNTGNQTFDGFSFTPHHVELSKYDPAVVGILKVCGDNHFKFFGSNFLSIHDSVYTGGDPLGVYDGRSIGLLTNEEKTCKASNLKLDKTWVNKVASFDFDLVYDANDQDGFIGEGYTSMTGHFSSDVISSIQIDRNYASIGMLMSAGTNFILSSYNMSNATELWGCVSISGNTLDCIVLGFTLSSTADSPFGILGGAGGMIEAKLVLKPSMSTFSAAGKMYLDLSLGGLATIDGSILLINNYSDLSVYGDLQGKINFSNLVAGLKAEGHVNWLLSPGTQYLQGRVGIEIFGTKLGAGASAGVFIGNNVPREDVWVMLDPGNRYSVSVSSLPTHITGVYGFGCVSLSMNFGIFSGGIEIYAGVGAFVSMPGSNHAPLLPLPYVLANIGVSLHGEILWGLVSAEAWVNLQFCLGSPFYFQGTAGLKGCVLWVMCASADVTVRLDHNGFKIE